MSLRLRLPRAEMVLISASVSVNSAARRLEAAFSRLRVMGIAATPCWMIQRSTISEAGRWWRAAISCTTFSSMHLPRASGL